MAIGFLTRRRPPGVLADRRLPISELARSSMELKRDFA